jgi:hypothetical protein
MACSTVDDSQHRVGSHRRNGSQPKRLIYDGCVNRFVPLLADAILPSLVLVWPITILLLLPIIGVEARYARSQLNLSGWEAFRVFGVANIASTVVGLPIATALVGAVQNRLQIRLFGTRQSNFDQWSRGGDVSQLTRGFGQYPRWTLIVAAVLMFVMCFLISWWVEAAYVKWWISRRKPDAGLVSSKTSYVVRNANVISYFCWPQFQLASFF